MVVGYSCFIKYCQTLHRKRSALLTTTVWTVTETECRLLSGIEGKMFWSSKIFHFFGTDFFLCILLFRLIVFQRVTPGVKKTLLWSQIELMETRSKTASFIANLSEGLLICFVFACAHKVRLLKLACYFWSVRAYFNFWFMHCLEDLYALKYRLSEPFQK